MGREDGGRPAAARAGSGWVWIRKQTVVDGRAGVLWRRPDRVHLCFPARLGPRSQGIQEVLSRLVRQSLHVYAPALPGFGGGRPGWRPRRSGCPTASGWRRSSTPSRWGSPVLALGHSFGGGVAVKLAHDHPHHVRGLVLINSVGGSAWAHSGSTVRSMAEQEPALGLGHPFPGRLLPIRQARRASSPSLAEGLPNLIRDPRSFWLAAGLARRADLTVELDVLRRRRFRWWCCGDSMTTL